jgi:predicted dehydrogenase
MMEMLRFGILGAGAMGNAHIGGLTANGSGNVEYAAVCDADREKCDAFAARYGLEAYYDFEEMLADDTVDVVDLCLPSFMHEKFAVRAARAKKHILVEKPVAFTLEEARSIYDAGRENGVRVMTAQVLRFWPEYVKIRELIQGGELGEIITVYAGRLGQMPTWGEWYKDPDKSGETLMNLTLHDIDYVHSVLGEPKSVYSAGTKDECDNYNDVMNVFKFENGTNVLVDGSLRMTPGYPFTMHMRVLGTGGTVEFLYKAGENIDAENSVSELTVYHDGDGGKQVEYESYDAYGREVQYFADCIESGKETETVTERSVLTVLRSVIKAKESLAANKVYGL